MALDVDVLNINKRFQIVKTKSRIRMAAFHAQIHQFIQIHNTCFECVHSNYKLIEM